METSKFKGKIIEEVHQIIQKELKSENYDEDKVPRWINNILEKIMFKLDILAQDRALKLTATCAIIQRTGHGVHSAFSCYWDKNHDDAIVIQYPKKVRGPSSIICIVTVFCASLRVNHEEEPIQ